MSFVGIGCMASLLLVYFCEQLFCVHAGVVVDCSEWFVLSLTISDFIHPSAEERESN
jgi:hypothetical protein